MFQVFTDFSYMHVTIFCYMQGLYPLEWRVPKQLQRYEGADSLREPGNSLVLWIFLQQTCIVFALDPGGIKVGLCVWFIYFCIVSWYSKYILCIHRMMVCIPDHVNIFCKFTPTWWGWNPFDWYISYESFLVAQPLPRFPDRSSPCSGRNHVQSNIGSPGLTAVAIRLFLVPCWCIWWLGDRMFLAESGQEPERNWRTGNRFWKVGVVFFVSENRIVLLNPLVLFSWHDPTKMMVNNLRLNPAILLTPPWNPTPPISGVKRIILFKSLVVLCNSKHPTCSLNTESGYEETHGENM